MKNLKKLVICALAAATLGGCAYAGSAAAGNKVVVLRNDAFLFGVLRQAYVCDVTDAGLSNCKANENP